MGWTFQPAGFYKNGKIDRKAECDDLMTWSNNGNHSTVVKSAMHGSTYYAAIKYQDENERKEIIYGIVILTSVNNKDYCNFGHKEIDETMGPFYYDCPKSILDLLAPTENVSANEWRKYCRENLERNKKKSVPVGTVVEFKWNGETRRAVRHAPGYQFKRPFWMDLVTGKYYPQGSIPRDFTIVTE